MSGWLLDTNVLSELRKPRPDAHVARFVADQPGGSLFVSEVTFAEIRFGIERLSDAARRTDLTQWLDRELRPLFSGRVIGVDEGVILRWRLMVEEGRRRRHTFSQPDLFIAACAAHHGLITVSRDAGEFVAAGVPLLDPWTSTLHARGKTWRLDAPVGLRAAEALASRGR